MGSVLVSVHRGVCAVEQKIRAIDGSLVDVDANGDVDCGGAHDGLNFGKVFRGLFFIHVLADHEEFITSHAEGVVPVRVVDQDPGAGNRSEWRRRTAGRLCQDPAPGAEADAAGSMGGSGIFGQEIRKIR